MARVPKLVALFSALAFVLFVSLGPAGADTTAGVAYLRTTQQSNGGWDASPAIEFATTEALLGIAEQAQTGATWSTAQAFGALDTFDYQNNPANADPLTFADDMADGVIPPSLAGKLILMVAAPLGLSTTDFDPKNDTVPAVNLETALDPNGCAGNLGSFGFFNETLFGMLAKFLLCGAVPPAAVTAVRSAQQADGAWNFTGSSVPAGFDDFDTTANAIQALIAAGAAPTDPDVVEGLAFLATHQDASGAWIAFGAASPESTSRAILAITAAGYDPGSSCWRDTVAPALAGTAYGSPVTALTNMQNANGSWGTFGPDFSTGQAIQGLERQWLPVQTAPVQTCVLGAPPMAGGAPAVPAGGAPPGGAVPAGAVVAQPNFTG
jgi:Prenyltransferase and squalene oxidase repeat